MRNSYIVTDDTSDPKRLRRVFQTMRSWGDHLQDSKTERNEGRLTIQPPAAVVKSAITPLASRLCGFA